MDRSVRHFEEELGTLQTRLLEMGGLAEERVRAAVHGLVAREVAVTERVLRGDEPINQLHVEIDERCFRLLALYQPMATDLRSIVAAVKINSDLERVGDLAVNIAEAARRYLAAGHVAEQQLLPRMCEIAEAMLNDALQAFVTSNLGTAQAVLERDDSLDSFRDQVNRRLVDLMTHQPQTLNSALELMLISRHLERIGDHATNIAEEVIYWIQGRDVRHGHALTADASTKPPGV